MSPFPPDSLSERGGEADPELVILLVVLGVEAVEDPPAEGEDGPAPGQAIAPVELMVDPQVDGLDELDGVEDQTAGLQNNWRTHAHGQSAQRRSRKRELTQNNPK